MTPKNQSKLASDTFLLIYFVIPAAVGLSFIFKVFLIPGCAGFDSMDGGVHNFPNLLVAQSILRAGQIPMMNFFNNFGTPLLGDGITLPFSIASLPYFFMPAPVAMTVARFVMGFLTMAVLTRYFRSYFSAGVSSVCALLVLFSPGALWSFPSYHYQMTLFWAGLILLLQEKFAGKVSFRLYAAIYFSWLGFLLSAHIHPLAIFAAFALGNQVFLLREKDGVKSAVLFAAAMGAALIPALPEVVSFFGHLSGGQRFHYSPYDIVIPPGRILLASIGGVLSEEVWHYNAGRRHWQELLIYFSIPLLVCVFMGLYGLWKERRKMLFWKSSVLGIAPLFMVFSLLLAPTVLKSIPVLQSSDITRFFWFSSFFMMIPAGYALEASLKQTWTQREFLSFGCAALAAMAVYFAFLPWHKIALTYNLPLIPFALFFAAGFLLKIYSKRGPAE